MPNDSKKIANSNIDQIEYYMNAVHNAAVASNELYDKKTRKLSISPIQNMKREGMVYQQAEVSSHR